MKIELKVVGMSCGHCVHSVKEALQGVSGVKSVEVDLNAGSAKLEADESTPVQSLIEAVKEEGYEASLA